MKLQFGLSSGCPFTPFTFTIQRIHRCFPNGTLWQDYATVTVRDGDPGRSDGVSDV